MKYLGLEKVGIKGHYKQIDKQIDRVLLGFRKKVGFKVYKQIDKQYFYYRDLFICQRLN